MLLRNKFFFFAAFSAALALPQARRTYAHPPLGLRFSAQRISPGEVVFIDAGSDVFDPAVPERVSVVFADTLIADVVSIVSRREIAVMTPAGLAKGIVRVALRLDSSEYASARFQVGPSFQKEQYVDASPGLTTFLAVVNGTVHWTPYNKMEVPGGYFKNAALHRLRFNLSAGEIKATGEAAIVSREVFGGNGEPSVYREAVVSDTVIVVTLPAKLASQKHLFKLELTDSARGNQPFKTKYFPNYPNY